MAEKKKSNGNHDEDYDRWGRVPGSIRITKPKTNSVKKTATKTSKRK